MKVEVQGYGKIIARFMNGEIAEVETLLFGEGDYCYEDINLNWTTAREEWIEICEDDVSIAYPDECEPEHEYPMTEIIKVIDFENIEWSER